MCIPHHLTLPSLLPACAETPTLTTNPFIYPLHPSTPLWHHNRFLIIPKPPPKKKVNYTVHPSKTVLLNNTAPIKIFISTTASPLTHLKFTTYAIFHHHHLIISNAHLAPSNQAAYLLCLKDAFSRAPPSTDVLFFYADSSLPSFIFNHCLLPNLPYVTHLTDTLHHSLPSHLYNITGYWYSHGWSWP
jgi:hypothetical protein